MAQIDVLKAQIVRNNEQTSWGFRLQGGVDQGQPFKITRITPGSPAARIGLKSGDEVTEIGDTPTEGLTFHDAQCLIAQYGLSLILTVERRAFGAVPINPVMNPDQPPPLKSYQTYDMSGGKHPPRYPPEFQTAQSRPFVSQPPRTYQPQPQPAPPVPEPEPYTPYHAHAAPSNPGMQAYIPQHPTHHISEDDIGHDAAQSRTFKVLQSLMSNEAETPPPPATLGKSPSKGLSAEPANMGKSTQGRTVVNKQFNTPIGLYSPHSIADTLEGKMESVSLDEKHTDTHACSSFDVTPSGVKKYNVSETWRLVQEMDMEEKLKKSTDLSKRRPSAQPLTHTHIQQNRSRLSDRRSSETSLPAHQRSPHGKKVGSIAEWTPGDEDSGFVSSQVSSTSSSSTDWRSSPTSYNGASKSSTHDYTSSDAIPGLSKLGPGVRDLNSNNNNNNNNNNNDDLDEDEEPMAGTSALPRPQYISSQQWKAEQEEKRRPHASPRVQVFMPQQYNSPLGMYSAQNIVETFQNQAETQMQELERHHDDPISGAQRAVYEEQYGGAH